VARSITDYLKQYPPELVKTITTDSGKEFAKWEQIEKELNWAPSSRLMSEAISKCCTQDYKLQ